MNWPIWDIAKTLPGIVISTVALAIVVVDRRPRLELRPRVGKLSQSDLDVVFTGVIEVYNVSSRANAIRGYHFFCREKDRDDWKQMESERFSNWHSRMPGRVENWELVYVFNQTPKTLEPYSGIEVPVKAIIGLDRQPDSLNVRIGIKDLFGKYRELEVKAVHSFDVRGGLR